MSEGGTDRGCCWSGGEPRSQSRRGEAARGEAPIASWVPTLRSPGDRAPDDWTRGPSSAGLGGRLARREKRERAGEREKRVIRERE